MLIETITFEIPNIKENKTELYLMLNTPENQEKVMTSRFTRAIKFTKTFDFQFKKGERIPAQLMDVNTNEFENEFCEIDEMVGMVI